jgi:hypothetical protein
MGIRTHIRSFIEELLEAELDAALGGTDMNGPARAVAIFHKGGARLAPRPWGAWSDGSAEYSRRMSSRSAMAIGGWCRTLLGRSSNKPHDLISRRDVPAHQARIGYDIDGEDRGKARGNVTLPAAPPRAGLRTTAAPLPADPLSTICTVACRNLGLRLVHFAFGRVGGGQIPVITITLTANVYLLILLDSGIVLPEVKVGVGQYDMRTACRCSCN